ncbi:hypothetical protein KC19_6G122100, partial [Ceratodon purpureus]
VPVRDLSTQSILVNHWCFFFFFFLCVTVSFSRRRIIRFLLDDLFYLIPGIVTTCSCLVAAPELQVLTIPCCAVWM